MVNAGDTAWVLASAALVLLMTPGLAFFYGGMVRSKSVLNMLMMNFVALGIVGVLWVLYGFSLAFGNDIGGGLLGGGEFVGLANTVGHLAGFAAADGSSPWPGPDAIPVLAFVMFQLMFAIITPALISGAIADRVKFWAWCLFVVLWATIVYFPVAHWVFSFDGFVGADAVGGWIANASKLGALDFAGGTAVHINAGAAGLALAIVLGKRRGWPRSRCGRTTCRSCCSAPACCGSAGSASTPVRRWPRTTSPPSRSPTRWSPPPPRCSAGSSSRRSATASRPRLGAASGAVAGLVAITPACGYVTPLGRDRDRPHRRRASVRSPSA